MKLSDLADKQRVGCEDNLKYIIEEEYSWCRCKIFKYTGPGWYYFFRYTRRCPRGCCDDEYVEVLDQERYVSLLNEEIHEREQELSTLKEEYEQLRHLK